MDLESNNKIEFTLKSYVISYKLLNRKDHRIKRKKTNSNIMNNEEFLNY